MPNGKSAMESILIDDERNKRKYFATAAKRSRQRRKREHNTLTERNNYLENVLNPILRKKCEELQFQFDVEKMNTRSNITKLIGPILESDSAENLLLKEQSAFYREREKELNAFMATLNRRIRLQNRSFQIQKNFLKLIKRVNLLKDIKLNKFCRDDSFYFKNRDKISIQSFENESSVDGIVRKRMRIDVKDLPLSLEKLKKTWLVFDKDPDLICNLIVKCYPNLLPLLPDCQNSNIVDGEEFTISRSVIEKTLAFVMYGRHMTKSASGCDTFIMAYSLMSDYTKDFDDLSVSDPSNLRAYVIQEGRYVDHSNITAIFEYQENSRPLNEKRKFVDFVKLVTLGFDASFIKLFLKQSLLVNKC